MDRRNSVEWVCGGLETYRKRSIIAVFVVLLMVVSSGVVVSSHGTDKTVLEDLEDGEADTCAGENDTSFTIQDSSVAYHEDWFYKSGQSHCFMWEDTSYPHYSTFGFAAREDSDDAENDITVSTEEGTTDRVTEIDLKDDGDIIVEESDSNTRIDANVPTDWMYIEMVNLDYSSYTYDIRVWDANDNLQAEVDGLTFAYEQDGIGRLASRSDTSDTYIDFVTAGSPKIDGAFVSGEVTNSDNDEVEGVYVNASQSGTLVKSTQTDQFGDYSMELENGTYNITASKQGYKGETKTVTVEGVDQTVDFEITKFNQSIKLKTRSYIDHGHSTPYSVIVTVNGDRQEVTSNSTVTSGDTSVVTIDSENEEVVATSNISVNKRTFVRAEWSDSDGNTYTTERNVTVANQTVENIDVLPTFPRIAASLDDTTIQVIIIATMVGSAVTLIATSFAGLSATTMIMLLGWLAGFTNNGMAIVTVLFAMFVGMNVAGNVDYTVRR